MLEIIPRDSATQSAERIDLARRRGADRLEDARVCGMGKRRPLGGGGGNVNAARHGARKLDGSLQLFASDIDDREGGGDAIKCDGKRG